MTTGMFDVELFLGYPVEKAYAKKVAGANPHLLSAFVNTQEGYLADIEHQGTRYFGKTLGMTADIADLEMSQANIMSLLKKVVPDHIYEPSALVLVAIPRHG